MSNSKVSILFSALIVVSLTLFTQSVKADLVAFWNFDSGTTDSVKSETLSLVNANTNGGTLNANGGYATGTGSNNSLTKVALPTGSTAFTISAFLSTTNSANQGIVGWGNYGTNQQCTAFRTNNEQDSSGNGFKHYWWANDLSTVPSSTIVNGGLWNHVVAIGNSSMQGIYINGQYIASRSASGHNAKNMKFAVGATNNFSEKLYGSIDNASIYSNIISQTDIINIASSRYSGLTNWWKNGQTIDVVGGISKPSTVTGTTVISGTSGEVMVFNRALESYEKAYYQGQLASGHAYVENNMSASDANKTTWLKTTSANLSEASTTPLGIYVGGTTTTATLTATTDQLSNVNRILILGGGTLALSNSSDTTIDARRVNFDSGSISISGSGKITYDATIQSTFQNVTIASGCTFNLNTDLDSAIYGTISGSGDFIKNGSGTLLITNPGSSYSGLTTLKEGTIKISNTTFGTGTVSIDKDTTLEFYTISSKSLSNTITGSGTIKFTGNTTNSSHFDMTNSNLSGFDGNVVIESARVLAKETQDIGKSTTNIDIKSGGQLYVSGGSVTANFTIAGTGVSEGSGLLGSIRIDNATLNGTITLSDNASIRAFMGDYSTINSTIDLAGHTLTFGSGVKTVVNGAISGSGSVIYNTDKWYDLYCNSDYTGVTRIERGKVCVYNNNAFGKSIITLCGGTLYQYNQNRTFTNDIVIEAGTSSTIDTYTNNNMYLKGDISGSGTVSRVGPYTLFLSGDNSAFAGTFNAGGTNTYFDSFSSGSENATWNVTSTLANHTTGNGTIKLGALTGSGTLRNDVSGLVTYEIGALNTSTTFTGTIKQATKIVKVGKGTLTLSGNNSYTGGTEIKEGTLKMANSNALGTYPISIAEDAILHVSNVHFQRTTAISGAGTIEFSGSSSTAFKTTGTQSGFTGKIVIDPSKTLLVCGYSGSSEIVATDDFPNATLELGSKSNLVVNRSSSWASTLNIKTLNSSETDSVIRANDTNATNNRPSLTVGSGSYAGIIGVNGSANKNFIHLIKASDGSEDGGTLTLSGTHYYTGGTEIKAGTLKLTDNATLGTGKVVNTGTLEFAPATNESMRFSNEISGGTLLKSDEGTLYLNTTKNPISSTSFDVKTGNLMYQGKYTGNMSLYEGSLLSPGNSVGKLTIVGGLDVKSGSTLLFEQDSTGMDQLILESGTALSIDKNAILELTMGEAISGATYLIVDSADQFKGDSASSSFWNSLLSAGSDYFWNLSVVDGNKVYAQIDRNAVPEPSTWALLILGFAGLMWLKRKHERR